VKVGIINYGMGNLGSVRRALGDLGADVFIAEQAAALFDADRLVLPGVGAFAEGMSRLRGGGWMETIRRLVLEEARPMLGICLGMQMLAGYGEEGEGADGLGLIQGRVKQLDAFGCTLRIPHVGWNEMKFLAEEPLLAHIPQLADFYFVHSYAFAVADPSQVIGTTSYGVELVAAVRHRHVFGTQFHPEKSSRAGRRLLQNFLDYVPC